MTVGGRTVMDWFEQRYQDALFAELGEEEYFRQLREVVPDARDS